MKKKKIFLLLFFVLILFTGCFNKEKEVEKEEETKSNITPILYKVTKPESDNIIYLFGSIHVADKSIYPFPDFIMDAYNESEYLAVEVDIVKIAKDTKAQADMLLALVYEDGTTLKEHLSLDTYNKLSDYFEENDLYDLEKYGYYKPFFFESALVNLISLKAGLTGDGVDEYLLKLANKEDKEILEIESMEEQLDLVLGLDDRTSELLLKSYLIDVDASVEDTKELYEAWKSGSIEKLLESIESEDDYYTQEELALAQAYNQKLVYDRNITMTLKLDDYFNENKKVFFTVGAAHVVGEEGIANRLIEMGYSVELVK